MWGNEWWEWVGLPASPALSRSIRGKDAKAWSLAEMSYRESSRDRYQHAAEHWWRAASLQAALLWKLRLGLSCRSQVVCTSWVWRWRADGWCQRELQLSHGWEGRAESGVEKGGVLSMVTQCSWPDSSASISWAAEWAGWHVSSTRASWACVTEGRMHTLPSSAWGAHSLRATPHVESIILVYCNTTLFWQSRLNSYYPIRPSARIMSRLFMWSWLGKYFPPSWLLSPHPTPPFFNLFFPFTSTGYINI